MAARAKRPLVLWLGHNADPILRGASDLDPFAAVAVAFRSVGHHDAALADARNRGLATCPDLECWREQFGSEHPSHPLADVSWTKRAYDPDRRLLSEALAVEIAEQQVEALINVGADWLPSPGHVVQEGHSLPTGRRNELLQAHAHSDVTRSRGAKPVDIERPRPIRRVLATITIKPAGLQHTAVREIPPAYAEVDCDAYLIRIWSFSLSREQYLLVRRLAHDLQELTGRPCIVEGLRHLTYGALRNEIAGAVVGYERGALHPLATAERARQLALQRRGGEKPEMPRAVVPYARTILKALAAGEKNRKKRLAVLRELNCTCGRHDADGDIRGVINQLSHNLHAVRQELSEAIAEEDLKEFAARLRDVERRRRLNGLGKLESGWKAVLEAYRPSQQIFPPDVGEL